MQLRAQQRVHRLRLFGRGRQAGADGPHRLVGDDDLRDAVRQRVDDRRQLALDDAVGLARLALRERLADADDRRELVRERGLGLVGDELVALGVQRAALGVADDHVAAAELGQHRRRHLAGVGARLVRRAVLRAPGDGRAGEQLAAAARGTGTARTRPHRSAMRRAPTSSSASSAALAARLPFIFQLPTTSLRRIRQPSLAGLGSPRQHQLADVLVRLHQRMRLRRLGGREHLVDHRLDAAGCRATARPAAAARRRSPP